MNIVVTLTTVPNRLYYHNGTSAASLALKTLLEQSYKDYSVHFNIPLEYMGQAVDEPDWVADFQTRYKHLKVYRTPDYGSITKLLPTLERVDDANAIIITADDDLFYMDGIIPAHLAGRIKYPDCALGFAGMASLDGSCHFCTTMNRDVRVKVLEGYKTISYKRSFFDIEEFKAKFLGKSWRDDETLSAYMGYRNIQKIVLSYDGDTDFTPRVESFPVIGHVPCERGGCNVFRDSAEAQAESEKYIQEYFKLGYLER